MTLTEYIKQREKTLDYQLDDIMSKPTINTAGLIAVNSAMTELMRIKVALEEGVIIDDSIQSTND